MDVFVKIIIVLLLFFTPFAFAGAEPWGFSVLQGGIVLSWTLLLFSRRKLLLSSVCKPVFFTLGFLIFFTLLQSCFPKTLLDRAVYYPVSFMPLYSWDHASLFFTYLATAILVAQLYISQQEVKKLLFWVMASTVAVALCFACFPKGDYIFYLAGIRSGVGPFLNRNHAAVFFVLGALSTLGLFFSAQLHVHKLISSREKNTFYIKQICLFLVFLSLCTATVLTRSRGGMLSLLVGLFCYAFLYAWIVPTQLKKRLRGIFATLAVLVLVTGAIYTHIPDINAFSRRATGSSTQTRKMLYRSANRILAEYPVWGIGVGAMPVVITSYVEYPIDRYIERLHSDWLEILLGVGYAGSIPVAAGVLWYIWLILRRLKHLETRKQLLLAAVLSGLCAMSVGSLVDFHFFIPADALLFFILLGITCAPTYAKHHIHEISLSWWLRGVLLVVLLLSLYIPTQKTIAWRSISFGRTLKTQAKLVQYEKALSVYPSHRNAVRLGYAYLNAAQYAKTPQERERLRQRALEISSVYLRKYPREKELSALYARCFK